MPPKAGTGTATAEQVRPASADGHCLLPSASAVRVEGFRLKRKIRIDCANGIGASSSQVVVGSVGNTRKAPRRTASSCNFDLMQAQVPEAQMNALHMP